MDVNKKQQEIEKYKESLKGKKLEELKEIEEGLVKEADDLDVEIKDTKFEIPEEGYEAAANAIRLFLNKQKCNWQYAPAYKSLYEFWDPKEPKKEITYPMLDTTLRIFGNMEFTGYVEWCAIIDINDYFNPLQEKYADLTEQIYDIASKHNTVLDAMGMNTPIEPRS